LAIAVTNALNHLHPQHVLYKALTELYMKIYQVNSYPPPNANPPVAIAWVKSEANWGVFREKLDELKQVSSNFQKSAEHLTEDRSDTVRGKLGTLEFFDPKIDRVSHNGRHCTRVRLLAANYSSYIKEQTGVRSSNDKELKETYEKCVELIDKINMVQGILQKKLSETSDPQKRSSIQDKINDFNESKKMLAEAVENYRVYLNTPLADRKVNVFTNNADVIEICDVTTQADIDGLFRQYGGPQHPGLRVGQLVQANDDIEKTERLKAGKGKVIREYYTTSRNRQTAVISVQGTVNKVYQLQFKYDNQRIRGLEQKELFKLAAQLVKNYYSELPEQKFSRSRMKITGRVPPQLAEAMVMYCELSKYPQPDCAISYPERTEKERKEYEKEMDKYLREPAKAMRDQGASGRILGPHAHKHLPGLVMNTEEQKVVEDKVGMKPRI
ncbi:MAG: hypothetical protein KIT56_04540, partial [Gammaproteobacteria bacterium]|nr:hypothetical protein [Gammaproteobacteria bacterium]